MLPVAVRTTQTSADEGRLKVAAGKGMKAKKKKKLMSMVKKSAVRTWASGQGC